MLRKRFPIRALLAAAVLAAACAPKKQIRKELPPGETKPGTQAGKGSGEAAVPNPGVEVTEASLRGGDFSKTGSLDTVYFEYDSFTLKEDTLAVLKKNAQYLKDHPEIEALVTGNCDERGTIEYNLALGQKRAKEVREYYIRLGVPGKSVATISYGKEKPECRESTEDCWAKNRRADTLERSRASAKTGASPSDSAP